jgi:hypothetical protein
MVRGLHGGQSRCGSHHKPFRTPSPPGLSRWSILVERALDCRHKPGHDGGVEGPNTLGVTPALSPGSGPGAHPQIIPRPPDHRDTPTQPPPDRGRSASRLTKFSASADTFHPTRCHSRESGNLCFAIAENAQQRSPLPRGRPGGGGTSWSQVGSGALVRTASNPTPTPEYPHPEDHESYARMAGQEGIISTPPTVSFPHPSLSTPPRCHSRESGNLCFRYAEDDNRDPRFRGDDLVGVGHRGRR